MHFQRAPHEEAKLVRCTRGAIFDVAVDLRPGSPTHGTWFGAELDAESGRALYIPEGCAHGFQTLVTETRRLLRDQRAVRPRCGVGRPVGRPLLRHRRGRTHAEADHQRARPVVAGLPAVVRPDRRRRPVLGKRAGGVCDRREREAGAQRDVDEARGCRREGSGARGTPPRGSSRPRSIGRGPVDRAAARRRRRVDVGPVALEDVDDLTAACGTSQRAPRA